MHYKNFIAIDWSGALGERHKGIAVAHCSLGNAAPQLLSPPHHTFWSRQDVLALLLHRLPTDCLIGMDLGISLPFADAGAFFPGWKHSPKDAFALWAMIDQMCEADPHLSASSFIDNPVLSPYFRRHGGREGTLFHLPNAAHKKGRLRVTEEAQARAGCKPYSNFNLVGAAQVGKSSLTGMRMLHKLGQKIPVWPISPRPSSGSTIVEIYTTLAAVAAGRSASRAKMTDFEALNTALSCLGSDIMPKSGAIDDHSADALITAAWLRNAGNYEVLWNPPELTPELAKTEGWTFGSL